MAEIDVSVVDPTDNRAAWTEVVEEAGGSYYHRPGWLAALEEREGLTPWHLLATKSGTPVGLLPNFVAPIPTLGFERLYSLPTGHGGPVVRTDREAVLSALTDHVRREAAGRWAMHLVTAGPRDAALVDPLREAGYQLVVERCGLAVDLSRGYDAVFEGLSKDRRYEIRQARDAPIEVTASPPAEDALEAFYRVYVKSMERNGETPKPFSEFEHIGEHCSDSATVWLAETADGQTAAGLLNLHDEAGGVVHNHFAGVDPDHFEHNPTQLLHDRAMQDAIEAGARRYDLGATLPDFREGLFRYKEQYADVVEPYLSFRRPLSRPRYGLYRAGKALQSLRD